MKNFINIADLSSNDLMSILEEAKKRKIKRKGFNKSAPDDDKPFEGKSMAMIFEKPSTRTRMSFDIAVKQLGGSTIILNGMMVVTGHAVAYKKYSKKYLDSQNSARESGIGIWQGEFDMPWEWRRKYK